MKAVCLFSGGLDSACTAAVARDDGHDLYLLSAQYGQNAAAQERRAVQDLARHFRAADQRMIDLQWIKELARSGLTDGTRLGDANRTLEYVPFRNSVLLSCAVCWAESIEADAIYIGSTGPPWITPDNSPEYFDAFRALLAIGSRRANRIRVVAPFCRSSKAEVVARGLALGVPFELTWSCHNGGVRPCGQCSQCVDRLGGFRANGVRDPLVYEDTEETSRPPRPNRLLIDEPLSRADPLVACAIELEAERQRHGLSLMAPSLVMPLSVRQAIASVIADIDGEGYAERSADPAGLADPSAYAAQYFARGPSKYNPAGPYGEYVEALAQARIARLFATETTPAADIHVNVQPLSGTAANLGVLSGLLTNGDVVVSLGLASGGHLSHGAPFHLSGRTYQVHSLAMGPDERLDLDALGELVRRVRPAAVVLGASAYPLQIDWAAVRAILDIGEAPIRLVADVAHFAGLVASGAYPNPIEVADAVTFVSYKTLFGPRIGVTLTRSRALARKIDRAIFPGLQSSPSMGGIAGLAVSAQLASTLEYKAIIHNAVALSRDLAKALEGLGFDIAFGGTETHMLLWRAPGPAAAIANHFERLGIFCNANLLPGDRSPSEASGLRLGLVGLAARGLGPESVNELADCLAAAVRCAAGRARDGETPAAERVRAFAEERLQTPKVWQPVPAP
jgi:glycine hydroxymethyltransferase